MGTLNSESLPCLIWDFFSLVTFQSSLGKVETGRPLPPESSGETSVQFLGIVGAR